jgi:5-methylcytosine-specific restriction protein A
MPKAPPKQCNQPGCPELVHDRSRWLCPHHDRERHRRINRNREQSSTKRYDREWRRIRAVFLREHPYCVECQRDGRIEPATECDHIVPLRQGGTHEESGLQALCKRHHSQKTMRELNAMRRMKRDKNIA